MVNGKLLSDIGQEYISAHGSVDMCILCVRKNRPAEKNPIGYIVFVSPWKKTFVCPWCGVVQQRATFGLTLGEIGWHVENGTEFREVQ